MISLLKEQLEKHNYKFIEIIGRGGYSVCMRVSSVRYPGVEFVSKMITLEDATGAESYYTEIKTLSTINNLNIVNIYDYFVEDNTYFIILEYCCGGSLDHCISENGMSNEILTKYLKTIFDALNHLHEMNIAHHDIKPANFFLDKYGRAKLGDFGIAKKYDETILSNNRRGSLPYAAPEMFSGDLYDPFKADVWALGISVYQLSTGKLPFVAPTREQIKRLICNGKFEFPQTIGPVIRRIIERCLQKNPNDRPNSTELIGMIGISMKPYTINLSNKPRILKPSHVNKSISCYSAFRGQAKLTGVKMNSRIASCRVFPIL